MLIGFILAPSFATGCGLDWTLPTNHFDGVEEHGYVSYWEKIGEADLGDKLVIPININFNSHREAISPILGKGWMVALLESHVEPLDENSMKVVMPDGWNFYFYRNGNTETWGGNAGWVGETNNTVFTIKAPCGWSIKFDGGKIQKIGSNTNRTLSYKYNGPVATEVDLDGKAFVQVENNTSTGLPGDILIGGQKIDIATAQRPRIMTKLNQNLVTGFDQSLSALQWPDGRKESFTFGTDKNLNPTLAITPVDGIDHTFTWDAATRQIRFDGNWSYNLQQVGGHLRFNRVLSQGQSESYENDGATGLTIEKSLNGNDIATYRFVSGLLIGRIRKVEEQSKGSRKTLYSAIYFPSGNLVREFFYPDRVRIYSDDRKLLKETIANNIIYEQDFDNQGRLIHMINPAQQIEVKRAYDSQGGEITQVFKQGAIFYTETTDSNNNLLSFNKGNQ